MSSHASSSSSQESVSRSINRVRLALLTSVTCFAPAVSFHTSQVSIVPNANSPLRALSRAPSISSSNHLSFVPEKYGSRRNPVFSRTPASHAARLAAQKSAVRRSCHTIAGAIGSPLALSQTTTVSRWLVIPIPAISAAPTPAPAIAACAAANCVSQISAASCSTQPGLGKCWVNSLCPFPATSPFSSNTIARELVVP